MKKISLFLFILAAFISFQVAAQNFPIGHRTMNFTDIARNNRAVPTEVYYPAQTAGENTVPASGAFPVLVFGHGFLMGYDSYFYLRDSLVPLGYILALARTETGILPNHLNFGKDLAFLVVQMKTEGNTASSPFFGHVDSTSAIMGHSMGGGASFLGCENNTVPTAMITLAAAETSPSAISAAAHITIPSLVFSADKDCVTPPAQNQIPMYDSLASVCKVFINVKGGGHCYFADYNFTCSLGEITCQSSFTITREQQHDVVIDFLVPYLDYYLKKIPLGWSIFADSLQSSARINQMTLCTLSGIPGTPNPEKFAVSPNPLQNELTVYSQGRTDRIQAMVLRTVTGSAIYSRKAGRGDCKEKETIDFSTYQKGVYFLEVTGRKGFTSVIKLVKY